MQFCTNCGKEVTENENFCTQCGNAIQNTSIVVESVQKQAIPQQKIKPKISQQTQKLPKKINLLSKKLVLSLIFLVIIFIIITIVYFNNRMSANYEKYAYVNTDGSTLRLRAEPNTTSNIVASLLNGSKVKILKDYDSEWVKCYYCENDFCGEGYLSKSFLGYDKCTAELKEYYAKINGLYFEKLEKEGACTLDEYGMGEVCKLSTECFTYELFRGGDCSSIRVTSNIDIESCPIGNSWDRVFCIPEENLGFQNTIPQKKECANITPKL